VALALAAAALWAAAAPADPGRLLPNPLEFLRTDAGFSASDIGSLEQGRILAKVVDTDDASEVLAVAAMKVHASTARVLKQVRAFEGRRRPVDVIQAGSFSAEPSARDLAGLTLDPQEVNWLAKCRPYDCDVRLPVSAIARFRSEIDWSSPPRVEKATALWHETLAGFAAAYLARGNAGLVEYDNNDMPVKLADSYARVMARSSYLADSAPELYRYLSTFPRDRPSGLEEYLYWIKEKFWIKHVTSLNHVMILTADEPSGHHLLAVSKQIYANQYFESSLSVTTFVESPAGGTLVYISRSRADIRRSGFNFLERALLRRLVVGRLKAQFQWLRGAVETPETH
jgi:hypothetical protein